MKLENTKNASRAISSGMVLKVVMMLLQFILRTIFIRRLGAEYIGLNSLFGSILSILNIAELGICSSIIYCMYKPIAEDNMSEVCALMQFFKKCYHVIGLVILVFGLSITPFLKYLIRNDLPSDVNLYILYFLVLANTVASYYMYSYKVCLFNAFQRVDIKNIISIIIGLIQYFIQIALIYLIPNYYIYLTTNVIFTLISNLIMGFVVDRVFPTLKANGQISTETKKQIISKVKGMLVYKLSSVLSSSFDSFVISGFLGLAILGKLNNYSFISTTVGTVLGILTSSIVAGIGNSLVLKSKKDCLKEYMTISFLYNWLCGWCSICILCLSQNFIKIWAGNEFLLPMEIVVVLAIMFYVAQTTSITNVYREASGIWDKDKLRPVIAAVSNLVCNVVLVGRFGVIGVLLSSIIINAVFILGWSTRILFKTTFQLSSSKYYKQVLYFSISTALAGTTTYIITNFIKGDSIIDLILKGIICVIVPNIVFVIMLHRLDGFSAAVNFVKKVINVISKK